MSHTFAINPSNDKVKGMLYAVCLGDALGLPYEFRHNKANKYTGELSKQRMERHSRFGAYTQFDYGQLSDDSEMTIILARHVYKYKSVIADELIMDYMNWANHKTTCCLGRNTLQLFKGVKTLKGQAKRYEKINMEN
jgi:ADP-ribosylglycohydrolase